MVQAKCTVNKLVAVGVVVTVVIYYAKAGVVEWFVLCKSRIVVFDIMIDPLIHTFFILLSLLFIVWTLFVWSPIRRFSSSLCTFTHGSL